jgi:glycerophosphoryl diester phosphodiesterase
MISLERRDGRPLRIGHRGAPALAPENTLASFRAAVDVGVDLVEFDVTEGPGGELVIAHSRGEIVADTPSLEEALAFFAEEAQEVGLHLDLKLTRHEGEVVAALRAAGLARRSFVSSFFVTTARAVAELDGDVRTGMTIPRSILGISEEGRGAPAARVGLVLLRGMTPIALRPLLWATRAHDVAVHHSIVSEWCVRAAHARGAAVVAWTVDDPAELRRVEAAGVDAVVTNDPRIFTSTLQST